MKKFYAVDLLNCVPSGEEVEFMGWVKNRRKHTNVVFLDISDSTGFIQAVVEKNSFNEELFKSARRIAPESAVSVSGVLMDTGKTNPPKEIHANDIKVVGVATLSVSPRPRSNLDIFMPELQEQLLDKRHFYLRNEKIAVILRFRHLLTRVVHQ